ncbi:hypothetical protein MRX96_023778 [Rhipicephalus microplus]
MPCSIGAAMTAAMRGFLLRSILGASEADSFSWSGCSSVSTVNSGGLWGTYASSLLHCGLTCASREEMEQRFEQHDVPAVFTSSRPQRFIVQPFTWCATRDLKGVACCGQDKKHFSYCTLAKIVSTRG